MPLHYRLVFLSDVARILLLPSTVVTVLLAGLSRLDVSVGAKGFSYLHLSAIYALSIPSYWICDAIAKGWKARFQAWRLGVGLIRAIYGKKVGNTDVLQRSVTSSTCDVYAATMSQMLTSANPLKDGCRYAD